jgi:hypothetical protein
MSAPAPTPAQVPVPAEIIAKADPLIREALEVLDRTQNLVWKYRQLEGAVELLRPSDDGIDVEDSDALTEAWHTTAGVVTLHDVLLQVAALVNDLGSIADRRPVPETRAAAEDWRASARAAGTSDD